MIFTDSAIILFRQDFREADRVASLYTREHGRINVRLPGVARSQGKLKAFSEPFAFCDMRIYVRRGGVMGTVTGGKIRHIFPNIRTDLNKMALAFHFCELIQRLTPLHQPSEGKFELLLKSLTELENGHLNSAFAAAFTLRLMTLAGFGLDKPVLKISSDFWRRMHEDALSSLVFTEPEEMLMLSKTNSVCRRFLSRYLPYPLNTTQNFRLEDERHSWDIPSHEEAETLELPSLETALNA